jgi:integrase
MKGHIRERSPGHWAIVIDVRDPQTGKRKRRWHSFRGTKREAQIESARVISELRTGAVINPNKLTVSAFLDRFEADWISVHVSALTGERYRDLLKPLRRHLGDRLLQKVSAADIAALYADLFRSGKAPSTIRLIHRVTHRALGQAKTWGLIRENVAGVVKPPKAPDRETEMLQPDRAALLLERLRGKPLYLIVSLALATGMRRNEMLGLRWRDVDLDAARLTVEQSLERTIVHGIRAKSPKTRHGRRTISLPAHIVTELRAHWRAQQERRLAVGLGKAPDDAPVFATVEGTFMNPDAVTHAWGRQMEEIGMPDVRMHSLRHTHASMLIGAGVDILTVSRRLGHGSPRITLEVYGHLVHGGDDRAARIMEAAFGSKMVADGGGKPGK